MKATNDAIFRIQNPQTLRLLPKGSSSRHYSAAAFVFVTKSHKCDIKFNSLETPSSQNNQAAQNQCENMNIRRVSNIRSINQRKWDSIRAMCGWLVLRALYDP